MWNKSIPIIREKVRKSDLLNTKENGCFAYDKIGKFSINGEWVHPRRTIKTFELIVVLEGTVCLSEGDSDYVLYENDAIILEPDKEHFGTKITSGKVSFYWLHFYADRKMPFKVFRSGQMHDVKYLLRKLLHLSNSENADKDECDAVTFMIFKECERLQNDARKLPPSLIGLIKETVRNEMPNRCEVADIAKAVGYNKDYIGKIFSEYTGVSLKDYIAKKRISYAENLLLTTEMSVKEVAAALGYDEENTFIKFFVYHKGISPRRFKNQYFNTHVNNK